MRAGDGVQLALTTEQITVTVSADIMKQVSGVDDALVQVVDTVEEYASLVVNVLVTIVEDSFLYELIELIIALISLFIYLEDIENLSHSLRNYFEQFMDDLESGVLVTPPGTPTPPTARGTSPSSTSIPTRSTTPSTPSTSTNYRPR